MKASAMPPSRSGRGAKPPRPGKTRVSSSERRESILAAARTIFIRQGFSGARTKDIAAEAGINEALIYRHFESKNELFDSAVIEPLERWMSTYRHIGEAIPRTAKSEDRLALLQRTTIEFMHEIERVLPLLGIALFASEGHGGEFYRKRLAPLIERWAERTRLSIAPDARGAELDPRFLAMTGLGISIFMAADAYFRGEPFDYVKAGVDLARLMLPVFEPAAPPKKSAGPKPGARTAPTRVTARGT